MPIRPDQRARYPEDWAAISARIRHERAADRCECDGRCRSLRCPAYVVDPAYRRHRCTARNGEPHPSTGSVVVLTVAHLDHQPEHSTDGNLLALCQCCHLAYDADHHQATRAARARAERDRMLYEQRAPTDTPLAVLIERDRNRNVYEPTTQEEP